MQVYEQLNIAHEVDRRQLKEKAKKKLDQWNIFLDRCQLFRSISADVQLTSTVDKVFF
jgi:hypothetical protein